MHFYSATTGGFYDPDIFATDMPPDVCKVSDEEYNALINAASQGLVVRAAEDGRPVIAPMQRPTLEQLGMAERAWRDEVLLIACALRDRHRDEQELFIQTTLTPVRFVELLGYIQKLRDWPQSPAFPDQTQRPVAPTWLAEKS